MPLYTIVNDKTGDHEELFCSYDALQETLEERGQDWRQELIRAPALVTHTGNVINKTSGDWKNLMDNIKKGSGKGNTVKS